MIAQAKPNVYAKIMITIFNNNLVFKQAATGWPDSPAPNLMPFVEPT